MNELNFLFDSLNIKLQNKCFIKNKLLEIVQCYLHDTGMKFDNFDDKSKYFISKYGEEIVVKEIQKYSSYVNRNDVKDIIENCLE